MNSINRFSSRRQRLDHAFLRDRLKFAKSYKRIAGYFRSSIFELVGEEIASIDTVQIICNSELDAADVIVSKHAREMALKERWNGVACEVEALLYRDRYRYLYELLTSGKVEIRVVPKDRVFIHGKAGVITAADGTKTCFMGSINETKSAFTHNYEILWEDTSPEGVAWVEEEFDALWPDAYPLPDGILAEVKRIADRVEIRFPDVTPAELPAAALAESPIYRGGEQLQPWQRSFVTLFLQHRETYGKARLLLADEVGVGKQQPCRQCDDVGPTGGWPRPDSLSLYPHPPMAGGVSRQTWYSQCRLVIQSQSLERPPRAYHQNQRCCRHHQLPISDRDCLDRANFP